MIAPGTAKRIATAGNVHAVGIVADHGPEIESGPGAPGAGKGDDLEAERGRGQVAGAVVVGLDPTVQAKAGRLMKSKICCKQILCDLTSTPIAMPSGCATVVR